MLTGISRLIGVAGDPSNVINAGSHGDRAATWRAQIEYVILRRLVILWLILCGQRKS
jgi:hypothetical protein